MTKTSRWPLAGLLMLCLLLAAGCAKQTTPTVYLLLESPEAPQKLESPSSFECLQIGPVTVSGYLNQANMVVRKTPWSLGYNETHRWAEPLDLGLARLMAQGAEEVGLAHHAHLYPDESHLACQGPRISVQVLRFDVTQKGKATLKARWQRTDDKVTGVETLRTTVAPEAAPYQKVRALSGLVFEFCQRLKKATEQMQ